MAQLEHTSDDSLTQILSYLNGDDVFRLITSGSRRLLSKIGQNLTHFELRASRNMFFPSSIWNLPKLQSVLLKPRFPELSLHLSANGGSIFPKESCESLLNFEMESVFSSSILKQTQDGTSLIGSVGCLSSVFPRLEHLKLSGYRTPIPREAEQYETLLPSRLLSLHLSGVRGYPASPLPEHFFEHLPTTITSIVLREVEIDEGRPNFERLSSLKYLTVSAFQTRQVLSVLPPSLEEMNLFIKRFEGRAMRASQLPPRVRSVILSRNVRIFCDVPLPSTIEVMNATMEMDPNEAEILGIKYDSVMERFVPQPIQIQQPNVGGQEASSSLPQSSSSLSQSSSSSPHLPFFLRPSSILSEASFLNLIPFDPSIHGQFSGLRELTARSPKSRLIPSILEVGKHGETELLKGVVMDDGVNAAGMNSSQSYQQSSYQQSYQQSSQQSYQQSSYQQSSQESSPSRTFFPLLRRLTIESSFSLSLPFTHLPHTLQYLRCPINNKAQILSLPPNLTHLHIVYFALEPIVTPPITIHTPLPRSLTFLKADSAHFDSVATLHMLPPLQHFTLTISTPGFINALYFRGPILHSLLELSIDEYASTDTLVKGAAADFFPPLQKFSLLRSLTFNSTVCTSFHQNSLASLPSTLTCLSLRNVEFQNAKECLSSLPSSLSSLTLSEPSRLCDYSYTNELFSRLPLNLASLDIRGTANCEITKDILSLLPKRISTLKIYFPPMGLMSTFSYYQCDPFWQ